MPPDNPETGSPQDWLRYARSDLALAISGHAPEVLLESLCFHAQQATEKAVKAVLVHFDIDFPHTHNIRTLLDLFPGNVEAIDEAAGLTIFAVTARYPGVREPVEEDEYQEAVQIAARVIRWAENIVA